MNKIKLAPVLAAIWMITTSFNFVEILSGDLGVLTNQTNVNFEFSYIGMSVGRFEKEEDYVNKKVAEMNLKEEDKGDLWRVKWLEDRRGRFEPKFLELFNKFSPVTGKQNVECKYTFRVNTKHTEPGFNIGIVKGNAEIDLEIALVETLNKNKILCVIKLNPNPENFLRNL